MIIKLSEHRRRLKDNENAFLEHYEKAKSNMIRLIVKSGIFSREIAFKMADLIFEAQDKKPLFYFTGSDGLPHAWNAPKSIGPKGNKIHTWNDMNYYHYEIGHLVPINSDGDNSPENLCFMSGRCNQHYQSSLTITEVMSDIFQHNEVVKERYANLKKLHGSKEWEALVRPKRTANEALFS